MRSIICILLALLFWSLEAQELTDFLSEKESHSILTESDTEITILDKKTFVLKKHYKLIIKNKFSSYLKEIAIHYNDFRKIKNANVVVRDVLGREIEKFKLNDFQDYLGDFSSMASDDRFKVLSPTISKYPIEMEVSYEVLSSASLFYDVWQQPQFEKMRVISAQLKVIDKTKNNLRYLLKNMDEPSIDDEKDSKIYLWQINDAPPVESESYAYSEDYFSTVFLAPKQFEMDGYEGDLSSWESFGNWIATLNATRNTFTEKHLESIYGLGLKKDNVYETIQNIYRYLQETTRYISIQIGIGGYQPFETAEVHEKKYGDCKGLSFYTQSLLELFNIKSYYTLINAGKWKRDVYENFPDARFNHAILTVPVENDTIFLECTSQTNPFGYLGTFTGNRKALLIDGDNSKIIKTKRYAASENLHNTDTNVLLDLETTSAYVEIDKVFAGTEIEYKGFMNEYQKSARENKNWMLDTFDWKGGVVIDTLSLKERKGDVMPTGGFNVAFTNLKEFTKRGNRIFLNPFNYINKTPSVPKEDNRKTPIRIRFGYQVNDVISYDLSESATDYQIENNQDAVVIESKFGFYKRSVRRENNLIILERKFELSDGNYEVSDYEEFKNFLSQVRKNDRRKIILLGT